MMDRHTMAKDRKGHSEYLGDGVYVSYDGYGMWLTAEDGIRATDGIYIEPKVFQNLWEFIERIWTKEKEEI